MIEGKSRKRTNKNVLKEEEIHNIARIFANMLRQYNDLGGDMKDLVFDHVCEYIHKATHYQKSGLKLGVRGDSDERTI